jgi:hypothetical protein
MLTRLQRRILALLEEAGEEGLCSLTNSVARPRDANNELQAMMDALLGLLNAGFIEVAVSRDSVSLQWVSLPDEEATSLVRNIAAFVEWSRGERLWLWNSDLPHPEIVVTTSGMTMAQQVLSEDGWPEKPLHSYDV